MNSSDPSRRDAKRPLTIRDVLQLHSFNESHGSCFAFSPDGARLAFCVQRPLGEARRHTDMFLSGIARSELYTVDIAAMQVTRLEADEDCFAPSWSPCSKYLGFGIATRDAVRLAFIDTETRVRTVPALSQLQLSGMRPFEWIGESLLVCVLAPDGDQPWMLDLESQGARKAMAHWQMLDVPTHSASSTLTSPAAPAGDGIAHDFAVFDMREGVRPFSAHMRDPAVIAFCQRFESRHQAELERSNLQWDETFVGGDLVAVHAASGQALFLVEDQLGSRLLLSRKTTASSTEIFRTNCHLQAVQAGEIRDLAFVGDDGQARTMRCILPPGHRADISAPAVFWVYPGASPGRTPRHLLKLHEASQFNLQLLAAQGYVVIEAPLPIPECSEALDLAPLMAKGMQAAIDASVSTGLVDRGRMHVLGHSMGGWAVMSFLTTIPFFRSGIALSGISDLVSFHGSCDARMRYNAFAFPAFALWEMCERTFHMGGAPWNDPERYVRNSPIFSADRISTPLLIVHGDQDYVPIAQSEEMFSALLRLGRTARLVRYWGEGHVLSKAAHIEDLWRQIFDWLAMHNGSESPVGADQTAA